MKSTTALGTATAFMIGALVVSGVAPYDRVTWILEVAPILIALPVLWLTRRRLEFTNLIYALVTLHAFVLATGGAYTYARVPLGSWMADAFGLDRNPYDKIGHFFQGFVPALIAREIFMRRGYVKGEKMIAFLCICVVLAISAAYELVEWAAAVALGKGADEFLGTQGYQWDTQSDMLFALIGGLVALLILTPLHNAQIRDAIRK